jgi:hypothetical protein
MNITKASSSIKEWFDIAFLDGIKELDQEFLKRCFNRRHLIMHKAGRVDDEYLRNTEDSSVKLHQVVRIRSKEIPRLLELLRKTARNLFVGFESIEWPDSLTDRSSPTTVTGSYGLAGGFKHTAVATAVGLSAVGLFQAHCQALGRFCSGGRKPERNMVTSVWSAGLSSVQLPQSRKSPGAQLTSATCASLAGKVVVCLMMSMRSVSGSGSDAVLGVGGRMHVATAVAE